MKIMSAPDYHSLSRKAANIISAHIILKPDCVLGLATGSTPVGVYKQLVEWYKKGDLDFAKVRTVNLDEYCGLSPDHPQSYRHYMDSNLFSQVNIQPSSVHLPDGLTSDPITECIRYDQLINALGGIDLQLLGIGHNGHIGFNEPDEAFGKMTHQVKLNSRTIAANARFFNCDEDVPHYAITMGIRAIMQARQILLVVNGEDKAQILRDALTGPITPAVPGSILQLHPNVQILADESALSLFDSNMVREYL